MLDDAKVVTWMGHFLRVSLSVSAWILAAQADDKPNIYLSKQLPAIPSFPFLLIFFFLRKK